MAGVLLIFAGLGLVPWWLGLNGVRVLVLSRFWPQVEAGVSGKVVASTSRRYFGSLDDFVWRGEDVRHDGWGGGEVSRTTFAPELNFNYSWRGRRLHSSNRAFWNHRHREYSREEAQAVIEACKNRPFRLRLNPARPRDVYLGFGHFPWLLTSLWLGVGALLGGGAVAALLQTLLDVLHIALPYRGSLNPLLGVLPAVSLGWLLWEALLSLRARAGE